MKSNIRKRGRPSSSSLTSEYNIKKKRRAAAKIPEEDIRLDKMRHFPTYAEKKGRCKKPGCSATTKVKCIKCSKNDSNIYLCFTPDKNCFFKFHNEK